MPHAAPPAPPTPPDPAPDRGPGPRRAWWLIAGGGLALVALPGLLTALGQDFYIQLATRILVYGLAAASLDVLIGYGGLVSFGHAAFVGLGSYVVAAAFHHQTTGTSLFGWTGTNDALVAWPLAMAVSAAVAVPIGAISLRTAGIQFIMITLAFSQMLYFLAVSLRTYGGADGLALWYPSRLPFGLDLNDPTTLYYIALGALALFLALAGHLLRTRFGRILRGARDNDTRMQAIGFATGRIRLAWFVLAAAFAGLAGALDANLTLFVAPDGLAWAQSGELIVMVTLGGIGTLVGPVLGAAAWLTLEELLPELLDGIAAGLGAHWKIIMGPLLLGVVLFARRGLIGLVTGRPAGHAR